MNIDVDLLTSAHLEDRVATRSVFRYLSQILFFPNIAVVIGTAVLLLINITSTVTFTLLLIYLL